MERAVILGEATVPRCTATLPPGGEGYHADNGAQLAPPTGRQGGRVVDCSLASMERELIARTIHECDGNLSLVAQRLDIARQTLYNKIKKYGL